MWNTCFPARFDKVEVVVDDEGWFLADLKPKGGLYCRGAPKAFGFDTLEIC